MQQGRIAAHLLAQDRHHQQASSTARHGSHSLPREQRTGIISRPQTQQDSSHSQTGVEDSIISRFQTQQGIAATHKLESRGQASSAGFKYSKTWQPLTGWRAEDRLHQQASNTARHGSHSLTGEQRTGIISRLQTQQGTVATHHLESTGQASSAGFKHSKAW